MFEYSSIPQISDLSRCRLCFDNQTSLIHIFETTGSLNEVARSISEVLNFEVSAEDHFPPFICSYCSAKLFDFRAFKAKCYSLRETYKLILQRKAESVGEFYGGFPVTENIESRVFLERNIAEPNHEEVSLHNVSLLPLKAEDAAVDDGIGVSEQIEAGQEPKVTPYNIEPLPLKVEHMVIDYRIGVSEQVEREQKSKHSAFNVAESPIKTELVEDGMLEEAEMSDEAENDQIPERQDDSLPSGKQVWFQMNPPESEVRVSSEQSDAGYVPESSSYHLDGYPISNRKLGAEGEVMHSGTCSSVSGMGFPVGAADVTVPEMDDKSSGHSEASGSHKGSYKPQKKDVTREKPPNWEEEVFGGWRIDDSREGEGSSGENRNVSPSDKRNSGVGAEMENDIEYVRCHHCRESKLTKDELKRHIYSAHPSLFMDEVVRELNGKEVRRQRCTLCLKDFQSRANLIMHFMIHTDEKPFVCNFCSYRTRSNSYLTVHLRRHTGERPFKCTMCNFATVKGVNLKMHIRTHTGERPYKCKFCDYTSASKPQLKQHSLIHTEEKPYKCTMCEYSSRQRTALRAHLLSHSKEKPFQCHICGLGYMSSASLKVHVRTHTGEKPFKCDFCEYRARSSSALKQHLVSHGVMPNSADLNCKTCSFRATTLKSLKRHVCQNTSKLGESTTKEACLGKQTEGSNPSNIGDPLKCNECGYTADPGSNLEQHICKSAGKSGETRVEATLDKVAVNQAGTVPVNREDVSISKACSYIAVHNSSLNQQFIEGAGKLCEYNTTGEVFLNEQMVTNSDTLQSCRDPLNGRELIGENQSIRRDTLNTGGLLNNGGTPNAEDSLTCKVCGFIAPHDISLKHHSCKPPIEKPYKCEQCSYSCMKKDNLTLHKRIHTGDKLFKCEHCSYSTVYSHNFKVHMRLHTGEKPHKCHICDFGAVSNSALKVHIMKHTGEKPLKCELCEYSTAERSCLKQHMRKHTGEKPFKCHICDFRSSSSTSLKAHIHKHTGEKPFKCPHCKYSAWYRAAINVHLRRHETKGDIPAAKVA